MTDGSQIATTEYLDGFQYKQELLEFFPHAEGYVKATVMTLGSNPGYMFDYVYNYTDHLGNIRLSYTKDPKTGQLRILEENHYYPFGLKHEVYTPPTSKGLIADRDVPGNTQVSMIRETEYMYKYNGKEWQDELGLNFYDYGARNYDPALGRWMNMDPLAEMYPDMSPYAYAGNVPTKFVDYDGRHFGVEIDSEKKKITITAHFYASKEDMELLNEIAAFLNNQTGFVLKIGEGEDAEAYSIGFNITTEESSNPSKSAKEGNDDDKLGKMYNSFVQDSNDRLLERQPTRRGAARQSRAAIRDNENVFTGAHEFLHLLGSGHKDGIMKDGATEGGLTKGIYGAILGGVGIGNGSPGGGDKNALGKGHVRSGYVSAEIAEGTIMRRATFDRQIERAVKKRERKSRKQ